MEEIITYPSLPNIKVGGMRNKEKRIPLYGSVRFAVTGKEEKSIFTRTCSFISEELKENEVYINNEKMEGKPKKRVEDIFYALVKEAGANTNKIKFKLESENIGYPAGGGLASSAAGLVVLLLVCTNLLEKFTLTSI